MFRSRLLRDTVILTAIQLFLDSAALLLNVFITKQLGTSAVGILSLMGSFLGLAGILSNGNAFLCTSRLISEELGKPCGNANRVLMYGIRLCLILSIAVSAALLLFAETVCRRFFSGAEMTGALRIMPAALVTGALSACLKGYFNADRKSALSAAGDIADFVARCGFIVAVTLAVGRVSENTVCRIMIGGVIVGNIVSLLLLSAAFIKYRRPYEGVCSMTFRRYVKLSLPIMGGSILTSVLSSTNDALIPVCLRQYGDSAGKALGQFGIFEGIVLPAIFFPSVVLCSVSGIIVSETARASAAGNSERIKSLTERLKAWTLMFSIFAAAVMIRFGGDMGRLLGGGELAGRIITVIAPVIPFIYMEIVLEALIKGLGLQSFSSFNYLAEYIIRIASVLILVPRFGFYGIVFSYYASNIVGNCSRFIRVTSAVGARKDILGTLLLPVLLAASTMSAVEIVYCVIGLTAEKVPAMIIFISLWGAVYFGFYFALGKVKLISKSGEELFGDSAQQTVDRVL